MKSSLRASMSRFVGLFALALALLLCALPAHATTPAHADTTIDHTTPRRTIDVFLRAARAGDFDKAAQLLDLRAIPEAKRKTEGPLLARSLQIVLDRKLWIDLTKVSDEPDGDTADGPGTDVLGTIEVAEDSIPIALTRAKPENGVAPWFVSKATVAMIPSLYAAYGQHWLADHMPAALVQPRLFDVAAWQWVGLIAVFMIGWWGGQLIGWAVTGAFERLARRALPSWDDAISEATRGPFRWLVGVFLVKLLLGPLHLTAPAQLVVDRATTTLLVIAVAAYAIRVVHTGADVLAARLPDDTAGELHSRGIRTQLLVARRIGAIVIGLIACAAILIQFEFVRVGMSLLASAGIASVVVGFAAQRSLAGVVGGIQLSISQPIRIGDFLVIETESGTVEEINLTFVVLKLWDERRMIVPIAKLLETTYQNWSRSSPEMIGVVTFLVDPTLPVPPVRTEVQRQVEAHPLWDKRVCKLQVLEMSEKGMTLRLLVSVARQEQLMDVRCDLRESVTAFLQSFGGGRYLPRSRSETVAPPPDVEKIFSEPRQPA